MWDPLKGMLSLRKIHRDRWQQGRRERQDRNNRNCELLKIQETLRDPRVLSPRFDLGVDRESLQIFRSQHVNFSLGHMVLKKESVRPPAGPSDKIRLAFFGSYWSFALPHQEAKADVLKFQRTTHRLIASHNFPFNLFFETTIRKPMIIQSSCEGPLYSSPTSSPSRQSRIRTNYLSKLGITPTSPTMLRRNSDSSKASSLSSSSSAASTRRVRFDADATTTIPIPSHRNFDQRTKKNIWYTWAELQDAASRNAKEEWTAARPIEKHEITNALAFIQATYQRECQLQVFRSNKQLAIRNACLRPPVRPDHFMVWP